MSISYTYNDQGYRTSKTIDNGVPITIKYTLLGDKVIYETDGVYGIVYTYDYDGKIISFNYDEFISDSTDGNEYFYIRNQQGDITKIIDEYGNIEVEYKYDAWGNVIDIEDYSGQLELSLINQYTYRGYRYDSELNLYYLNSRFYNPVVGRFINADGMMGAQGNILGHNMYAYTFNNPINFTDETGYIPDWAKKVLVGVAIIAIASILLPGAGGVIAAAALNGAINGALIGAASGALISGGIKMVSNGIEGKSITNGLGESVLNGAASGFMAGAILGAVTSGFGAWKSINQVVNPNKLNHIFGKSVHNLSPYLDEFGGNQTQAYNAVRMNLTQMKLSSSIFTDVTTNVNGFEITARGIVKGVVEIGTFFIK